MKSFAEGKIDVYLGYRARCPGRCRAGDRRVHRGCTASLDIALQEIDSLPIDEAIINARWKGISVNVFVEQDCIRTKLEKVPQLPTPQIASGEAQAEAVYRLQWRSDQETAKPS